MKQKHLVAHMKAAHIYAECSTAQRAHVGCVIVKDNKIISIGYNGMPSGWSNECEYEINEDGTINLKTKPEVLHAETNAIAQLARTNGSGQGAVMFVTVAPCLECAKLIFQSGIKEVYYSESYRETAGIDFLNKAGVTVTHLNVKAPQI